MIEFFNAAEKYSFIQFALLAGVLISIASGIIGTYVAAKKITYIAGSIAHSVLGGIGAAKYLQVVHGWEFLNPIYGAAIAAIIASIIIGVVSIRAKEREDTVIAAIWAIGMAAGILFISKTPGYNEDLMSYLFGNILMVSSSDLWLIGILDFIVVAVGLIFYNQFKAICFDEEYARLRGINTELFYFVLLCLTSLTVVLLVTVVGIIMVIALLTLPIAMASNFAKSMIQLMALSIIFSIILITSGLAISYQPNLPAGATIIILSGIAYLAIISAKIGYKKIRYYSAR